MFSTKKVMLALLGAVLSVTSVVKAQTEIIPVGGFCERSTQKTPPLGLTITKSFFLQARVLLGQCQM
jgi:hypothetical protein